MAGSRMSSPPSSKAAGRCAAVLCAQRLSDHAHPAGRAREAVLPALVLSRPSLQDFPVVLPGARPDPVGPTPGSRSGPRVVLALPVQCANGAAAANWAHPRRDVVVGG